MIRRQIWVYGVCIVLHVLCDLRRYILGMIIYSIGIRDSFENFDMDDSGTLNSSELANALRLAGLNPTDKEVAEILKNLDKNRDGLLSYDEYREIAGPQLLLFEEKNQALEDAFEVYDKNGDGRLSKTEFRSMLRDKGEEPLTDEEIDELMTQLDKDGDGTVSLKEFKALLSSY